MTKRLIIVAALVTVFSISASADIEEFYQISTDPVTLSKVPVNTALGQPISVELRFLQLIPPEIHRIEIAQFPPIAVIERHMVQEHSISIEPVGIVNTSFGISVMPLTSTVKVTNYSCREPVEASVTISSAGCVVSTYLGPTPNNRFLHPRFTSNFLAGIVGWYNSDTRPSLDQLNFGEEGSGEESSAIPEPSVFGLTLLGLAVLRIYHRKKA